MDFSIGALCICVCVYIIYLIASNSMDEEHLIKIKI